MKQVYTDSHGPTRPLLKKKKSSLSSFHSQSQKSLHNTGTAYRNTSGSKLKVKCILPLTAPWNMYAIKMVDLHQLNKQKQIEHLTNERDILGALQERRE